MTIRLPGGLLEEELTHSVIGSFFDVHRELGFGYREYIYSLALEQALKAKGHHVEREVRVMIHFRGEQLAWESVDMIVDRKVMVENKAGERLPPDTSDQLRGYLCATTFEVGLILHYGREAKHHRVIYERTASKRTISRHRSTPAPPLVEVAARKKIERN